MHPHALDRFCERVLGEIDRVKNDNARSSHRRYLDIFEIVQRRDREIGRIFNDLKRSNGLAMLTQMRANDLLMEQEFSSLSADTRNAIGLLQGYKERVRMFDFCNVSRKRSPPRSRDGKRQFPRRRQMPLRLNSFATKASCSNGQPLFAISLRRFHHLKR